jgi:acetyl esterase/lipase
MKTATTRRGRLMSYLNEQHSSWVDLWTRLCRSAPPKCLLPCCVLALFGGCMMAGPPHEVSHPRGVDIETNLTFAVVNGHDLKLDLYLPHGTQGGLPLVMWIHGGGWLRGGRNPCPIAPLAADGYVVAAVDYRQSTVAPFPAQLEDVTAALSWIRRNPDRCHADPERLGIWGASAGGTLACLLGLGAGTAPGENAPNVTRADAGVKCVVAFFPATDLARLFTDEFPVSWEMRYAVRHFLGGVAPKDKPELAREASPINWVRQGVPPHLVVHGGNDRLIPPQHSVDYVEHLLKVHVDARAYIVGGFDHGSIVLAKQNVRDQVRIFLDHYLKPPAAALTH